MQFDSLIYRHINLSKDINIMFAQHVYQIFRALYIYLFFKEIPIHVDEIFGTRCKCILRYDELEQLAIHNRKIIYREYNVRNQMGMCIINVIFSTSISVAQAVLNVSTDIM